MRDTKCETVRRELEELMLGDDCSMSAMQHLQECGDCREFHQKQTKLRQIVGGLGMVEAPADFDFRLRARLAHESSSAGFHLRAMQWSFATKSFAAATLVLLFVGGVVYVRTIVNQEANLELVNLRTSEPPQPAARPAERQVVVPEQTHVVASDNGPRQVNRSEKRVAARKAPLAAVDFGSERPTVISNSQMHSPIFPIDASVQSLRFSFDDGRGNARTISVPTITFGSQRVLPAPAQLAQKRDTVW